MKDNEKILNALGDIFKRWQNLLASLTVEQITAPQLPSAWSIKNVIAHLWAWQQISIARAEAALRHTAPDYPAWRQMFGPDPEDRVDEANAWIYETNRDRSWSDVHAVWQSQFRRYLEILGQIPETDLLDPARYSWMGGYPLSASVQGSFEHHDEHFDTTLAWLGQGGKAAE